MCWLRGIGVLARQVFAPAAAVAVLGVGLLWWSAAMPQAPLRAHVRAALDAGEMKENYPRTLWFRPLDMFTECFGLGVATQLRPTWDSVLAMNGARECRGLHEAAARDFPPTTVYARYWHGYQIALKPLYTWFSSGTVRLLTSLAGVVLLLGLYCAAAARMGRGYAAALTLSFVLPGTLTVFPLATHGVQLWVVLGGSILCCLRRGPVPPLGLFSGIGAASALVSFLNMESLSLGLALLCWCVIRWVEGDAPWRVFRAGLALCAAWTVGFLSLWLLKWGLAWLVLPAGGDFFGRTLALYPVRSVSMVAQAVAANVLRMPWTVSLLAVGGLAWRFVRKGLRVPSGMAALLLPAAIPFFWLCLMPGHSEKHSFFVTVILWPSMAALCMALLGDIRPSRGNREGAA